MPPPSIKLAIILLGLTSFLAIWACKKDTINVQHELLTPTKNLKASERSLTDPSCCEFTNLFCTSALKPPCKTIYTGSGGDNVFVLNGLVVKGTTYQLTPLFNDGIAADFELTTGTGTNVLTNIPKQILVDGEININQPVEKEFTILYDIADLLQQGASIEAIQVRIGNKGSIETLSNGQKQLVVNSAAFENRDVSNLTVVSNSVDCLVAKQRVAERFSDLTGIPIEICQNIVTRDPNFSCSGCNNPMRLFNHFLTTLDVKDGKNWEIIKLSDQARTTYRNAIYKAFLENAVKMSSSAASTFVSSNNTMMRDLLKTTPTNSDWCGAYEKGKKTVRIKVLKEKYPEYSGAIDWLAQKGFSPQSMDKELLDIAQKEMIYQQGGGLVPTNKGGISLNWPNNPLCQNSFTFYQSPENGTQQTAGLNSMSFTVNIRGDNGALIPTPFTTLPLFFILPNSTQQNHPQLLALAVNRALERLQNLLSAQGGVNNLPFITRNDGGQVAQVRVSPQRALEMFINDELNAMYPTSALNYGAYVKGVRNSGGTAGSPTETKNGNEVIYQMTFKNPNAQTGCP